MLELVSQLEELKASIQNADINREPEFSAYERFRSFIAEYDDVESINALFSLDDDLLRGFKHFFGSLEKHYIKSSEFDISRSMLRTDADVEHITVKAVEDTGNHAVYESSLIDISSINTLIMIGSGPCPKSLIHYAINSSVATIVGIDYDKEAIEVAEQLLQKLGIADRVLFVHTKAEMYDYQAADVVIVGNFVTPKVAILKQVAETTKPDVKILLRIPTQLDMLVYDAVSEIEIAALHLKIVRALDKVFDIGDSTLLLRKL